MPLRFPLNRCSGMAGGGLKRTGEEALGVEGEGGSMFKMPRMEEVSTIT